jgi:hypothetical protein
MPSLSRFDKTTKTELKNWPKSYSIMYKVLPNGPKIAIAKLNGGLRKLMYQKIV